jgi:hypothetical protein
MKFEEAHEAWLRHHTGKRTGERKARLDRGHGHGEALFLRNVWWPLRGSLEHVHPEYEVLDWRGRSYFADLAWLPGPIKLLFEIKGFAAHVRDMDRVKYCNELNRETFLHAMGYRVISFAYDDVEQRPDVCVALLRMVLSRYQPHQSPVSRSLLAEKEIVRFAIRNVRPIRPKDIERHFEIDHRTAVHMLQQLCAKGWLRPALSGDGSGDRADRGMGVPESVRGSGKRVVKYELIRDVMDLIE